jgi:hypothetical protein
MNYPRLNMLWQTIGGFLAPVILTILIIRICTDSHLNLYQWLMWLNIPILFIHEYEEYVIRPDAFKKFVNTDTIISLNPPQDDAPVNDSMIFIINMYGWIWAIAGALLAQIAPWVGAGNLILHALINCLTHPFVFQLKRKGYNPGLATTLLLLIPYVIFVFYYIIANNLFTTIDWLLTLALGIGVAVQLPLMSVKRIKEKRAQLK